MRSYSGVDRKVTVLDASKNRHTVGRVTITQMEDAADMLEATKDCREGNVPAHGQRFLDAVRDHTDPDFYGTNGSVEADRLLTEGWPEGAERVSKLVDALIGKLPPAKSIARKRTMNEHDGEVDVSRWLNGNPELFRGMKRGHARSRPTVHLLQPMSTVNWTTREQMFWNGAVGAAATILLERAGYRVALDGVSTNYHRPSNDVNIVVVSLKKAQDRLNENSLAYCLAHPASYRQHLFNQMVCEPESRLSHGFGTPEVRGLSEDCLYLLRDECIVMDDALLLPRCSSEKEAIAAIEKVLETVTGNKVRKEVA